MTRIRRVDDRKEMESRVEDFLTRGYKVKDRGETSTRLKKKNWGSGGGHIAVAALTIWWTFGVGNVAYALYKYFTAEEVHVKVED